jgi:hypothetical protein
VIHFLLVVFGVQFESFRDRRILVLRAALEILQVVFVETRYGESILVDTVLAWLGRVDFTPSVSRVVEI